MNSYILGQLREQLTEKYVLDQRKLMEEFHAKRDALDEQISEAKAAESHDNKDPYVLVRMSLGAKRKVYHWAEYPCGRTQYNGGNSEKFKRMRESEAQNLDGQGVLKRCSACWSDN